MSKRMTLTERIADVSRRSGFSDATVEKVLKACQDSIMDSLVHGEKATLPGLCVLKPSVKLRLKQVGGQPTAEKYFTVSAKPMQSVLDKMYSLSGEEVQQAINEAAAEDAEIAKIMKENNLAVMNIAALE